MLWIAVFVLLVVAPLLLGLAGVRRAARTGMPTPDWSWRLSVASMLHYALAFNLTFFVQELFLVVPKALTPGLRPTLFHNNHGWEGQHPLASLFQGTGAAATLLLGLACAWLLRSGRVRRSGTRLFLLWMAYCGVLMALPQVVIGALSERSDVGMAMAFFGLEPATTTALAFVALACIGAFALGLLPPLLGLATAADVAGAAGRTRFVALAAALPALLAIALIVPFRVPREAIEVVLLPVLVTVPGLAWMLAGAWRARVAAVDAAPAPPSIAAPLIAAIGLLLVFQGLLRPGVAFY